MDTYLKMLRKSIKRIEADFEFSADIDHNGSKGSIREYIIEHFLRPFLPKCYGVSGGQAFDCDDNTSRQLDIVIYDDIFSYIAPYGDNFIYFPCESVYGNIEVKSRLDQKSFFESVENIASLKRLKRDVINGYQVNPMKDLNIKNMTWASSMVQEYFGMVFAYESVSVNSIFEYIKTAVEDRKYPIWELPNMIVLFDQKTIICRCKKDTDGMIAISHFKQYDGFLALDYGEDILSAMMLSLFVMIRCIDLKALDIEKLIGDVNEKCLSNTKGVVPHVVFRYEH